MNIARRILNAIALVLLVYFVVATGLIYTQQPVSLSGKGGLDFLRLQSSGIEAVAPVPYKTRNDQTQMVRVYPAISEDKPLLV